MRRMEKFLTGFTSSVARSPESAGAGGAYLLRWPIIPVIVLFMVQARLAGLFSLCGR